MCNMCGVLSHATEDCDVKMAIKCPMCGSGTYIHCSGLRVCSNASCSWIDEKEG